MATNDVLHIVAAETARECSRWIRDHAVRGAGSDFWPVLMPLLRAVTSAGSVGAAWATASVVEGDRALFHPVRMADRISNDAWELRRAITRLSDHRKILHTTELCLSVLRDGCPLVIHATDTDWPGGRDAMWHLGVQPQLTRILPHLSDLRTTLLEIATTGVTRATLRILDEQAALTVVPTQPHVLQPMATSFVTEDWSRCLSHQDFRPFYRYIAIVSAIVPNWRRITMVPALFPTGHLSYPGGLVICEDAQLALAADHISQVQAVSSIGFWPWQLTARPVRRDRHPPMLRDIVASARNDYRRLEHLFAGVDYTLTDAALAPESHRLFLVGSTKPALDDNESPARYGDAVLISQEERQRERKHKSANLADSHNVITIVIPIAPTPERLGNLRNVLRGVARQRLIREWPRMVELIVVVDGCDYPTAAMRGRDNEIVGMIMGEAELMSIQCQVFQRNRGVPLGPGGARNVGVKKSRGSIIQLLDDSIVMHPDFLLEVAIRYEHLPGQKFALLGFKHRVDPNAIEHCEAELERLLTEEALPDVGDDWKLSDEVEKSFVFSYRQLREGDIANYMRLTGDLCFLTGSDALGIRRLSHFFSTAMVALLKDEFVDAGGFRSEFAAGWGLEDTLMGSVLVARGNRLVPCYSMTALDLRHKKSDEKLELDKGRETHIRNHEVYERLMAQHLREFSRSAFERISHGEESRCDRLWSCKGRAR